MTARAAHRAFDSSQSRVRPVLTALEAREPDGNWVKELLRIAQPGPAEPRTSLGRFISLSPDPPLSGRERALAPPRGLLVHLLEHAELLDPKGLQIAEREKRRRLLDGDPETLAEARTLLEGWAPGMAARWWLLEGPTYPDVVVEFDEVVLVVEGKRTEAGPTTTTSFMPVRHQMLRHMDAAYERFARPVVGLFAVEGRDGTEDVPVKWQTWAREAVSDEVVRQSLPHRNPAERELISRGFAGVVTWQRIVSHFSLPPETLLAFAPGWHAGADGRPVRIP